MPEYGSFGGKLLAAFGYAGKHGRKARLHGVVDDAIKRHGVGDNAQQAIMDAIDDDPALMVEMLDELKFRRPLVERFMQKRIAALRNQGATIKMPSKDGDRAGHSKSVTHTNLARPAEQNAAHAARGGHETSETHNAAAPATQQNGGQTGRDTQFGRAAKDGMGHSRSDTQPCPAHPSTQQPKSAQHRTAMLAARNKTAHAVLTQTSMVSGKPYGDLTKPDLENEVRRADHRGQFARRVLAEAKFADDATPLKRVMDETSAAKLWSQAWEAVTHAA